MKRLLAAFIAILLLHVWPVTTANAADAKVYETGIIAYSYLNAYEEEESDSFTGAYVVKDGIVMVPSVSINRFKTVLSHTGGSGGKVTITDNVKSLYYEMKIGSPKVTVLNKDKIKQSEFTLSTDISVHLVGDYPCYPLDLFEKIGYKAEYDGKRTIAFDLKPQKAEEKKDDPKLVPFSIGSKYGYMDAAGTVVIEPEFDGAQPYSEDMAAVKSGGKWGYIDASGKMGILPRYDTASAFSEEIAVVGQYIDGELKVGYLHKSGRLLREPDYAYALPFSEGYGAATYGHTFFYLTKDGVYVLNRDHEDVGPFSEGLSKISRKDKYGYMNKRGEEVIALQYDNGGDFAEGLAAVSLNGKWGYIDKNGDRVIPLRYDHAGPFEDGLATVMTGGLYGLIDTSGNSVAAPKFEAIGNGRNGYWPAQSSNKWGYIDSKGNWVIEPVYDFAYGATNQLFTVQTGSRTFYVNSQGTEVVPRDASGKEYVRVLVAGKAIEVNGNLLELDTLPAVIEGTVYVPVQPVLEKSGWQARWDSAAQTLTASRSGLPVSLQTGNKSAQVNGTNVELAGAPLIFDDTLYVPASFLKGNVVSQVDYADYSPIDLEAMGMEQTWNDFMAWAELYNNADFETRLAMALQIEESFNALEAEYAAKFQSEPNNASAYLEYAVLLGELAQMFELDELWNESAKMASIAGQISESYARYYKLHAADRLMDGQEKAAQYRDAAEADPYLVLNHALTSGTYYDAGVAFSEINGKSDLAIYSLKLAAEAGTEEERRLAESRLADMYSLSDIH
ncbi:MAG: serine/threonine protein kinase [Paenibacillus sp.]|nr:serine/threonine protein kinase [Paenibacillus sp.]